jgi:hypothetical protein
MKTKQLKEKDLLKGKLLAYSAAAGALLAVGSNAEAQVKYTDVDPDEVLTLPEELGTRDSLSVDLNGDGIIDVKIMAGNGDKWGSTSGTNPSNWMSIRAKPSPGGEVNVNVSYLSSWQATYYFANRFDADAVIGPDLGEGNIWSASTAYSFNLGWLGTYANGTGPYNTGPWIDGETDKYLGIRFTMDEGVSYHYGWIRLDVPSDQSQVTIKDYAYEQTAGVAITAGDMGSGNSVRDGLAELGVNVFSVQKSIIISDLEVAQAQADVFNVSGQLVRTVQIQQGRTEIPMENDGLYIVKIDMGGEIISSKVIVQ